MLKVAQYMLSKNSSLEEIKAATGLSDRNIAELLA